MKVDVKTLAAKDAGAVDLDDAIFGIEEVRADLLQRAVKWQLARRQAGTHKVKERGEIKRTKKRFGRQKGGGGARHGARSSHIFVGGGVAHGPRVRSHAHDLPKKVRALALKHALSSKAVSKTLFILDDVNMTSPKSKDVRAALANFGGGSVLFIDGDTVNENFALAARNVPNVDVLPAQGLNVYDILKRDALVLTKAAVDQIHARFGAEGAA